MAPIAFLLFLLCSPVHALFTPLDRTEFQVGKRECLKENPTGHCPVFADKAPLPGQGTGTNGLLPQWDMSNVQALGSCFRGEAYFQQNLENWTMTSLNNAHELFMNSNFDGAGLEQWDVSRVLKAESMFQGAIKFNADLSSWNVASLTNIKAMFYGATKMDFNVENWGRTMPGITTLEDTFREARSFRGLGIESWDTSKVTNMQSTFDSASRFNGDVSNWDVSRVTTFKYMFRSAVDFDIDISPWDIASAGTSLSSWESFMGDARSFSHVLCSQAWIRHPASIGSRTNQIFPGVQTGAGPKSNLSTELCCPRGQESRGGGACELCRNGTFKSIHYANSANIACSSCPSGRFANKAGMVSAEDCVGLCPSGYYGNVMSTFRINVSESCSLCPSGRASLPGQATKVTECNACGFGSILVATTPVLICATCPSSTYIDELVLSTFRRCKTCPSGRVTCEKDNECGFGKLYHGNASQRNALKHRDVAACRRCPVGRVFQNNSKSIPTCAICPGGRYQDHSHSEHYYKDMSIRCKACPAGKFLADDADDATQHDSARDCVECKTKTYSLGGERFCSQCKVGTYELVSDQGQITGCQQCPSGYFSGSVGSVVCSSCEAGKYQNRIGLPYCLPCVPGRFTDTVGLSECKMCPSGFAQVPGWYQPNTASDHCVPVPLGFIGGGKQSSSIKVPLGSRIACDPVCDRFESCQAQTIGSNPAGLSCSPCPLGYTSSGGTLSCASCNKGTFGVAGISGGSCELCPSSYFQAVAGQTVCSYCPTGYRQPFSGSEACVDMQFLRPEDCLLSEYLHDESSNEKDWSCESCPLPGGHCDKTTTFSTLRPKSGYWNITWSPFWSPRNTSAPATTPGSPFHRCKFKEACLSNGTCVNGSVGVLCAVCVPGHIRRASQCTPCQGGEFGPSVAIFSALVFVVSFLLYICRERIRQCRRRYGQLWRDVVRIITINVSFMQINSSLPSVMGNVEWPSMYLEYLANFDWVNFDILNLLGFPCIADMDYRTNVTIALCVPVLVATVGMVMYRIRQSQITSQADHIANDVDLQRTAAEYLFEVLDVDESGYIDLKEFQTLLKFLGMPDTTTKRMAMHILFRVRRHSFQVMRRLSGVSTGTTFAPVKTYELSREQFVISVCDGKIEKLTKTGNGWIVLVEHERAMTSYLSAVLVIFLLIHAPVSQRFFYYFATDNVSGKEFLHADYSIEYGSVLWTNFLPVVLVLGIAFVFLLPITIGSLLYSYWSHLHSPHTKRKIGFLYAPFHLGAEWWEVFELTRKMTLTGILIYFSTNVRTSVATLVCVLAVAVLNFIRPHKNNVVFLVCECGYLLTTFKYLSAVFVLTKEAGALTDEEENTLAVLLIMIDILMMVGSCIGLGAIVLVLRKHSEVHIDLEGEEAHVHALHDDFSYSSESSAFQTRSGKDKRRTSTELRASKVRQQRRSGGGGRRRSSSSYSGSSTFLEKLKELRLEEDRKALSLKNNAMARIHTRIYPTQPPPPPTATTVSGRKRSSAGKEKRRSSSERRRSSTTREVNKIVQRAKRDQEKKRQLLKRKSFIAKKKLSRRLKKRSREFELAAQEDE